MVDKFLHSWLEMEFLRSNHTRYHHYFKEWVSNLTEGQLLGFGKQMVSQINGSMINHGSITQLKNTLYE